MKQTLIYLYLISYICIYSQEIQKAPKKNRTFNELYHSVLKNDERLPSDKIIFTGDSLYEASINDRQKVKASFIIIQGYEMQHNWNMALKYALKADSIASKASITSLRPETNSVLGSLYSNLNLYKISIEYLNKALDFSDKLNRKDALVNKSLIYQRMSAVYHKQYDYKKALSKNLEALKLIEELKKEFPKENYSKTYIPVLLNIGVNYYNLKQYDLSKIYYQKAFKVLSNYKHNYYLAYFYIKYAATEIKLNNLDSALIYIKKTKELTNQLNDKNLESEINLRLNEYYTLNNDLKQSDSIKNRIINDYKDKTESQTIATRYIINNNEMQIKNEKKISSTFLIISVLLIVAIAILYIYYKYQSKKIKVHFNKIIEEFKNKNLSEIKNSPYKKNTLEKPVKIEKIILSEEKTKELLRRLEDFENSTEFTTKNFTISNMALLLKTNTKYISYILQEYRGKNFNDYLNGIRIKYITHKIINNPEYLKYKIDYLAEICGYSSHSRFSQIFKKELKISPSKFIDQFSKNKKH